MNDGIKDKLQDMIDEVSSIKEEMRDIMHDKIENLQLVINNKRDQLDALNPKQILARGYSITTDEENNVIVSIKGLTGKKIKTIVADGMVHSTVDKVEER